MEKIGIDVHKHSTQVCTLTEDGEYREQRIRTERAALDGLFGLRKPAQILLEAALALVICREFTADTLDLRLQLLQFPSRFLFLGFSAGQCRQGGR